MMGQAYAGQVNISETVFLKIAGNAALATKDVAALSGGISEGIARRLSGKNTPKGVSVTIDEHKIAIELRIIVNHGSVIHLVCRELQRHVHEVVETMTGKSMIEIHVKVEGIV